LLKIVAEIGCFGRRLSLVNRLSICIIAGFETAYNFSVIQDKSIPLPRPKSPRTRKKAKAKTRTVKKDPLWVDGQRPRPMYVDYKDVELLKKLVNRHGRIVGRRKTGCSSVSQHAVTEAIKRARFMALLPFKGD